MCTTDFVNNSNLKELKNEINFNADVTDFINHSNLKELKMAKNV